MPLLGEDLVRDCGRPLVAGTRGNALQLLVAADLEVFECAGYLAS
jgi:hypothetical protein